MRSLEQNLSGKISYNDITLTVQDITLAKANILPALSLMVNGVQVDPDLASSFLARPERQLTGELTLSQVINSEEVIAGMKVAAYVNAAIYRWESKLTLAK